VKIFAIKKKSFEKGVGRKISKREGNEKKKKQNKTAK